MVDVRVDVAGAGTALDATRAALEGCFDWHASVRPDIFSWFVFGGRGRGCGLSASVRHNRLDTRDRIDRNVNRRPAEKM